MSTSGIKGYTPVDLAANGAYQASVARTKLKGRAVVLDHTGTFAAPDFADATLYLCLVHIPVKCVVSGVQFEQVTQGDTTADAENRVGLYSIDPAGNTINLIASGADDGGLWEDAAGVISAPFSAQVEVEPGLYYTAGLVNWSAQTTEPQIRNAALPSANYAALGADVGIDLGGTIGSQAALPTSDALTDIVATANVPIILPY